MNLVATGPFDVTREPRAPLDGDLPGLGRSVFRKSFHGPLEATGHVEMMSVAGAVPGSAAYVAIERVVGTLSGREGSFVLIHRGVMTRGVGELVVSVAPDSGTGALVGLAGTMQIRVEGGAHSYAFEGTLPD